MDKGGGDLLRMNERAEDEFLRRNAPVRLSQNIWRS
jgi:hypothetical protein